MMMRSWWMVIVVLLATPSMGQAADEGGDVQRLRARVAELEKENAALRAELAQLRQSSAALLEQSRATQQQRDELIAEREELEKLAGLTATGESVASAESRFTSDYDAKADRTTVQSASERIDAGDLLFRTEHRLRVRYAHAGETMADRPTHVLADVLTFVSPATRYRGLESATFVVDGQSIEVPVETYEIVRTRRYGASVAGQKRYDEQLTLRLGPEALKRLGQAREATLQLGSVELPLERKHLALLEAARRRMDLAAGQ